MSAKIIAQLFITGIQVFSKAFGMAYQQALQNAKGGGASAVKAAATTRGRMSVDEALQVLNLQRAELNAGREKMAGKYERMFAANDPAAGGSFYLQSKVYRAKESLDLEIEAITKAPPTK